MRRGGTSIEHLFWLRFLLTTRHLDLSHYENYLTDETHNTTSVTNFILVFIKCITYRVFCPMFVKLNGYRINFHFLSIKYNKMCNRKDNKYSKKTSLHRKCIGSKIFFNSKKDVKCKCGGREYRTHYTRVERRALCHGNTVVLK